MDSPGRYCPTPGSMSSHPGPSGSPQAIPLMHGQNEAQQQGHSHHGGHQHPGYYGHTNHNHNYPMQQHSAYYPHPTVAPPVSGYYSALQQQPQQQQQNNHVPITTASAPPPVTHNPYHPQSQQAAPPDWQQHYYHPQQQQPHLQQQPHPQTVYPAQSHSPYGYIQTPQQQPMTQGHVPTPVHDNHMQQQPGALMNLSRFVSQSPSPSPSSSNHGQLINGNTANSNQDSQSPTRSITSPSSSCSANGQMIPVRLQNMGKGQARTKANMRKLAMEQNSGNASAVPPIITASDGIAKKVGKARTPKSKKSVENGESVSGIINQESAILDNSTLSEKTPDLKKRGRRPKNSASPEEFPVEKKKRQSKKSLLNQADLPINGDPKPVKAPRKPRKKKEVLPIPFNQSETVTAPGQEIQMVRVDLPKVKTPRGGRKKKSESLEVVNAIPFTNSPEKEYTLQIPEVSDVPTNTVKIVQTIKLPKMEKKFKSEYGNSLQERKAILEEEVAQVLLDLGKNGPPSPLKIVEAPTTMSEFYENTNAVHGIKVKKSLNTVDKKAMPGKVKTPRGPNKRKSAADTSEFPSEPKKKRARVKKDKTDSSPVGKRKMSVDGKDKETPTLTTTKKQRLSGTKEKSVSVRKKPQKGNKANRSPKIVATLLQPEPTPVNIEQDFLAFSPIDEFSKSKTIRKIKKSPRLSVDTSLSNNLLNNITSPEDVPLISSFKVSTPTSTTAQPATPTQIKVPMSTSAKPTTPIPTKTTTPIALKSNVPNPFKKSPVQNKSTTPTSAKAPSPTKATTPKSTPTPIQGKTPTSKTTPIPKSITPIPKATTPIPKAITPTPKASTPTKATIPTPKITTPTPKSTTPTPKVTTPTPKSSTPTPKVTTPTPKTPPTSKVATSPKDTTSIPQAIISPSKAATTTPGKSATKTKARKAAGTPKAVSSRAKGTTPVKGAGTASTKTSAAKGVKLTKRAPKGTLKTKTKTASLTISNTSLPTDIDVNSTMDSPVVIGRKPRRAKSMTSSPATPTASTAKTAALTAAKAAAMTPESDKVVPSVKINSSKRRSSMTSKNAISTSSSESSNIPVTSGPPTEVDPDTLKGSLPSNKPLTPMVPLPVISAITATASKIIKKRKSSQKVSRVLRIPDSTDEVILDVSHARTPLPDLEPIVIIPKAEIKKSSRTSANKESVKEFPEELFFKKESSPIPLNIKKTDIPKVKRPRIQRKKIEPPPPLVKPEPYQLNPKTIPPPTVFVKSTPLGTAKTTDKEKSAGPSLRVIGGKVKFYRGSDEEDNEAEPKLPRERIPVEFDSSLWICVFCQLPPQVYRLGDLYGPYYVKQDEDKGVTPEKREVWVHEECAVWAHKVLLVGSSLRGLDEAVYFGDRENCINCGRIGATVGCLERGCQKAVHVPCAKEKSWQLDLTTMRSLCPDHK